MSLLDKILLGTGAAVAVMIALIIIWLSLANAHLKTQLSESTANSVACHLANDDFQSAVDKQNAAIVSLKKESTDRALRALTAEQNAQKTIMRYQHDTARLKQRKSSGDDCASASALFDHYIAEAK